MNTEITIDINGRRTGKTSRLVDTVIGRLCRVQKSVIIADNYLMKSHIKESIEKRIRMLNMIPSWINRFDTEYIKYFSKNEFNSCRGISMSNCRWFYDDFDWYLSDDVFSENMIPIDLNGYYCTTPIKDPVECLNNLKNTLQRYGM